MNPDNKDEKVVENLDIYEPDEVDVEIEDLFLELDGKSNVSGKGTQEERSYEDNANSGESTNPSSTTSNGNESPSEPVNDDSSTGSSIQENNNTDNSNDMVDTSDDSTPNSTVDNSDSVSSNNNLNKDDNLSPDEDANKDKKDKDSNDKDEKKDKNEEKDKDSNANDEKKDDVKNKDQNKNNDSSKNNQQNKKDLQNSENSQNLRNNLVDNDSKNHEGENKNSDLSKDSKPNSHNNTDKNDLVNNRQNNNHNIRNNQNNNSPSRGNKSHHKNNNQVASTKRPNNKNSPINPKSKTPKSGNVANKIKESGKAAWESIKAFFKAKPEIAGIIVGVLLLVIILGIIILALASDITPSAGNDIKENESAFSDNDLKIIEEIQNITSANYRPNAELALAAVVYPYFPSLYSGNVTSLLNKDEETLSEEEKAKYDEYLKEDNKQEILESFGCDEFCQELLGEDGTNEIIKAYAKDSDDGSWSKNTETGEEYGDFVDTELESDDDPYLLIFRKNKYLKNYEELLKQLSTSAEAGDYESEEVFFNYLFDTYRKKDAGYKALFQQTDNESELQQAIKEDLISIADMFSNYLKENSCLNGYSSTSLGQVSLAKASKTDVATTSSNVTIHLGEAGCTTGNKSCGEGWIGSMADYVMGVTYEELGSVTGHDNIEKIEAQMLLAKQFLLNVATIEGDETNGYHLYVRWAQADQDFCDIYSGCQGISSGGSMGHGANRDAASSEMQEIYKEAWEVVKNIYIGKGIETDSTSIASGIHYMNTCPSNWICMNQSRLEDSTYNGYTYKQILEKELEMNTNSLAWLELNGEFASASIGSSSSICGNYGDGLGIPDNEFVFYYQNDYQDLFCGSNSTIAHSGCGGTSYAMLVANLSDNKSFNPVNASNEGDSNSCGSWGSNNNLFTSNLLKNHDGFTISSISYNEDGAQEVLQTIRNGGLVVANVQSNSPFTSGGHWIVIRGLTEDGKVKVGDPGSSDRSLNGTYDINDFISLKYLTDESGMSHSWFAVYGPRSEEIKKLNQESSTGEVLEEGKQNKYFAPIQDGTPTFKSVSSTPGCSNSVSHDLSGIIEGTKLYAGMDGTAEFKQTYCGSKLVSYGNRVQITGSDGTYIIYAHLRDFPTDITPLITETCPKNGSKPPCPASSCNATTTIIAKREVKKGEYIGTLGNTGNSTGPHLHVEIHEVGAKSCVEDPWAAFGLR